VAFFSLIVVLLTVKGELSLLLELEAEEVALPDASRAGDQIEDREEPLLFPESIAREGEVGAEDDSSSDGVFAFGIV
jgi:hypothetical protein